MGKQGLVLHGDNGIWSTQPLPSELDLKDVWAASANVWVAGYRGAPGQETHVLLRLKR